jgi:hypothetical protein
MIILVKRRKIENINGRAKVRERVLSYFFGESASENCCFSTVRPSLFSHNSKLIKVAN